MGERIACTQRRDSGAIPGAGRGVQPDGSQIATGSFGYDNSLQLWDVATQTAVGDPMHGHDNWQLYGVAFSRKGDLAAGGYDGTVRVWDKATGRPLKRMAGPRNAVISVAFAGDSWMVPVVPTARSGCGTPRTSIR